MTIREHQKDNKSLKTTRLALEGKINTSDLNPIKGREKTSHGDEKKQRIWCR